MPTYYLLWLFALAIVIVDYERVSRACVWIVLKGQLLVLDARLMASSFLMYLKISRELRAIGLEPPKFHYIPIEERPDV